MKQILISNVILLFVFFSYAFEPTLQTTTDYRGNAIRFSTKAFEENEIIGKVIYYIAKRGCWIDWLFVKENYRNKYLGKKLLQEAMDILKDCQCERVYIEAMNEDLVKYYQSEGFRLDSSRNLDSDFISMVWEHEK